MIRGTASHTSIGRLEIPKSASCGAERLGPIYEGLPAELRAALAERIEGKWYNHPQFLRQTIEKLTAWVRHFQHRAMADILSDLAPGFCPDVVALC